MELTTKQGFKQTEIGLIPEDWEVVAFDKIFTYYSTSNYSKAQMSEVDEVGCIHYGLIHAIPNTQYDLNNGIKYYVTSEQAKYEYVRNGDVIMVDASEDLEGINKSVEVFGIGDKKYISGLHTYLLRDKKGLLADKFRGIVLNSQFVKNQMLQLAVGMKVFGVSKTQLAKVKILLPPTLKEQKAIATALNDVDDLIVSLEGLIAKKQAIKQGAMQQLLTPPHKGGKRLPGFSGEWVEKNLGELAWFQEGPGLRKWQFTTKGIKVINITNLVNGYLDLDKTTRHISWDEFNKMYKHFEVDEHDIVVASSGNSYCKTSVVRQQDLPLVMNTSVIRFKPNSIMDYQLLLVLLKSSQFKKQIDLLITGGAQPNFGPVHLPKVFFNIPESKDEQKAIAKILSDMDTELEQLETKKAKYQQLKQGMLQELLTGNTRLV
ncbi:restriction endonuclease subunit S [Tenacibaculum maritimum]|uniref:restriction endonuclease subunit S n=1 Tax=Tenacibaculum maritimum TaxID=107401 RepID=UPI003875FF1A